MQRTSSWPWCVVLVLATVLAGETARAEELNIALSGAARDPLIDLFLPPPGSPDRVRFTPAGMLIQQHADVAGRKTGVAGFKLLLPAHGDFEVTLDLKCMRLEEPTEGWGQGLILSVFLDDKAQTVLKIGRLAFPKRGAVCQVEINHIGGKITPIYRSHKMPFKEGRFIITRTGDKAVFSVDNRHQRQVLETFPCPPDDMRTVELVCTRLDKGNTRAEFLLRHLRVKAEHFFAYQQPKQSSFRWWYVAIALQLLIVVGLVIAAVRQRSAGG